VDEVVNIMQDNIDKVMQRGERLDDLRGKTGMQKKIPTPFSLCEKRAMPLEGRRGREGGARNTTR
jgi:hypothetical protein